MPFEGLAAQLKQKSAPAPVIGPVKQVTPPVPQAPIKATPQNTGLFGDLVTTLRPPKPAPPTPAPVAPPQAPLVASVPVPKVYGPPRPANLPAPTPSFYKPDLSFGSTNSTLPVPTQAQQAVVNKAVDTVDKYQQGPGAGPAAVRTVTDTLKGVDEAMLATAQTVDPVTGQKKTKTRQAIDYANAGVKAVGLFPPFLAFSTGANAAENIQLEPPKSPLDVPGYVQKAVVKGGAKVVNKAFGTVAKAGGYGLNATQQGVYDIYNTATRGGVMRDRGGDVQPSPEALALGNELGGFAALLLAGKVAAEGAGAAKVYRARTLGINDVVGSAKDVLAVEKSKGVLGQEKRVAPEVIQKNYRDLAHETHPDKGGTPQQFQVVNQAKTILEDYNTLSGKEFRAKYQAPLAQVNKIMKQLPEQTGQPPQAPETPVPAAPSVPEPLAQQPLTQAPVEAPKVTLPPEAKIVSLDVRPTPAELVKLKEAGFTGMKIPDLPGPVMFDVPQAPAVPASTVSPAPQAPAVPQLPIETGGGPPVTPAQSEAVTPPVAPQPSVAPVETKTPTAPQTTRYEDVVQAQRTKLKQQMEKARGLSDSHFRYQRLDQLNKQGKAEGFELSAIKRGLDGTPTEKELQNAQTYLDSAHAGKSVSVDGKSATVTGKPSFGRIQVRFEDGTTKFVNREQIQSENATNAQMLEHIRKNAEQKLEEFASHYDVKSSAPVKAPTPPAAPVPPTKQVNPPPVEAPKAKPSFIPPKPQPKPLEVFKLRPTEVHDRIMTELVFAERGQRIGVRNEGSSGMTFSSQKSTFPQWVPKELRRKPVFEAVVKHLTDGTLPTKAAEKRLYQVVVDEINAQDGVINDTQFVQETRQNLINPFATEAENAAALAKFDAEYAKLKSGNLSSDQASQTPVPAVGEPVQTEAKSAAPAKESIVAPVEQKKSKVGVSVEAKTLEKGFAEAFSDTAGYTPITIKEQAQKVADLMNTDFETARAIINGTADLPSGMFAEALIKGMEDYALETGNAELALEIANSALTSETSRHAQALRLLAERNPDSPVAVIQKVKKIKEEAATRKGVTKEKVVEEIKQRVKKERTKATKETWASFIDSITCT